MTLPVQIKTLECVERVVRSSDDGTEITRVLFLDPYEAHPFVLSALLGGIEEDKRRKPSSDSYFPDCYCTEAWIDQVAKETMGGSDTLNYNDGELSDEKGMLEAINRALTTKEVPRGIASVDHAGKVTNAGCFITAKYKPLVCENPDWSFGAIGYDTDTFDFVDPQLHPITKTVSCGAGLKYLLKGALLYGSVGSEGFVTQPMQQFSIRRIMCPSIPTETIGKLKGKVNGSEFKLGKFTFAKETLRFDDCEVTKKAVPNYDGKLSVWYDLLYIFTWNTIFDEYHDNASVSFSTEPGFVGWNRILGLPLTPILGTPVIINDALAHISYYSVGWKSELFGDYRPLYLSDSNTDAVAGFAALFDPASP